MTSDPSPHLPPDHGTYVPPEPPRRGGRVVALVVLALVSVVAALGIFLYLSRRAPAEPLEAAPVARQEPVAEVEPEPEPVSTEEADTRARTSLEDLTDEPEWETWLAEKDLLRRFVGAVASLDAGESARSALPFLAPQTPYLVRELEDGRTLIDPETWSRYDALGRVIKAMPVAEAARAYREVQPLLQQFYREGAPPGARFEAALDRVLARAIALPLPEVETELVSEGGVWAYADPELESLTTAEKQFLRLGPDILRTLQQKAVRLRAELRGR